MTDAPQVAFPAKCPDCANDRFMPLVGITSVRSFTGNKIQVTWPQQDGSEDYANVVCPQCGIVLTIKGDARIVKSGNRLFDAGKKPGKRATRI